MNKFSIDPAGPQYDDLRAGGAVTPNRQPEIADAPWRPSEDRLTAQNLDQNAPPRYATEGGHTFWASHPVADRIPPGFYSPDVTQATGPLLRRVPVSTDALDKLPCQKTAQTLAEARKFWSLGEQSRARGLALRRGFLLWGPPGSGKTSMLFMLAHAVVNELDGIVVISNTIPSITSAVLKMVRMREPDRPIMVMLEDVDSVIDRHGEADLLALLDGDARIDNVFTVATTNFPSVLGRRFVDRPGRFDRLIYVGFPDEAMRAAYLQKRAPELAEATIDDWVARTRGWSIAHLRELIVSVCVFENDADETIDRLGSMIEKTPDEMSHDDPNAAFSRGDLGFHMTRDRAKRRASDLGAGPAYPQTATPLPDYPGHR